MSLDVYLDAGDEVFSANITHNLGAMAREAGIYEAVWRPEEHGYECAGQIVEVLEKGLKAMEACPEHFREFNAKNGWGTYDQFVPWVKRYLEACREYPNATIYASR